jgi:type II secretory pathway pseudopilin PulG
MMRRAYFRRRFEPIKGGLVRDVRIEVSIPFRVNSFRRSGLTLLEIVLALSLTVVVTTLIGGLIQIYQGQLEIAKDNVRQTRVARAILSMMADDIRSVLRDYQNDDAKTLEAFLTASASSKAGSGGTSTGSSSSDATSAGMIDTTATTTVAPPPGLIGTDSIIEIDVSRPPRPDEYIGETKSLFDPRIVDIPSDSKKVSYFVQAPQLYGIQDPLNQLAAADPLKNTGLVRRSLDRAITRWAIEQAQTQQLQTSGQIIAPEVVAISFSYFDGLQWVTSWDSNSQGLPWAVQITIAMQHSRFAREAPITPGTPLATLITLPKTETGLETYSTLVVIPGVQLLKTPAEQSTTTDGTESATSSLGF